MDFGLAAMKGFTLTALTVCPLPPEIPKVEVYFFPKAPVYISDAPMKAITAAMRQNSDTTAANHKDGVWLGLTEPKIVDGGTRVSLGTVRDAEGNTCFHVNKVEMVIHYMPTVFVAKELQPLPCTLEETQKHEDQHIAVDHQTIREYIPKIKMQILWHLRSLGVQGPFNAAEAPQKGSQISKDIVKAMDPMIKQFIKVRHDRQGIIDDPEENRKRSMFCADEHDAVTKVVHEILKESKKNAPAGK